MQNVYLLIDSKNNSYIDFESLLNFMGMNNFYPYEEEIVIVLRRFDRDDDGRLTF